MKIPIPTTDEISADNQALLNGVAKAVGFVPNLYSTFSHSETALATFLEAQNAKSSLPAKYKEAVSLIVSQVNTCEYCLSAHTVFAGKAGYTEAQIQEIRSGSVSFDPKLDQLVKLVKNLVETRGHPDTALISFFFDAGFTKENLVDVIFLIGIRTITNYVFGASGIDIDWPAAPPLTELV